MDRTEAKDLSDTAETSSKISMDQVFPNTDEILTEPVRRRLTRNIIEEIKERYEKHGPEYISDRQMPDGRYINQCMLNDSAQDAIEEVVDAIFNTIILSMKQKYVGGVLRHLVAAYNDLEMMRAVP